MLVKVKILKSCSGYNFSFKQGDTVDVSDYIGKDLIGCGFAEDARPPETETAETKPKKPRTQKKAKGGDANADA